jgi:hypothetical protein
MVARVIPAHLHLTARQRRSTEGLVPSDISLTALRTTRYPSYNRRNTYKFSSPPSDAAYNNITISPCRQINGTVPKDLAVNHIQPVINNKGFRIVRF